MHFFLLREVSHFGLLLLTSQLPWQFIIETCSELSRNPCISEKSNNTSVPRWLISVTSIYLSIFRERERICQSAEKC